MERVRYINNKDLLTEIHRSKLTFCYYLDDDYARYDAIVRSLAEITPEFVEQTRIERAAKLTTKLETVTPEDIPPESLVYRLMTDEHIPVDLTNKRKLKVGTDEGLARTGFPPFKHYVIRDGEPVEVLRSHWRNGFDNGEFCADHGGINKRLAQMFMLLVDRFSKANNWRSYCCDTLTEALTVRGWLTYDQLTTDDTILSYSEGKLVWSSIKSIYRGEFDDKMFRLTGQGIDALVTPRHKFLTVGGLKPVENLLNTDIMILQGSPVDQTGSSMTDSEAAAVAELTPAIVAAMTAEQRVSSITALSKPLQTMDNTMEFSDHDTVRLYHADTLAGVDTFIMMCALTGYHVIYRDGVEPVEGIPTVRRRCIVASTLSNLNVTDLSFNDGKPQGGCTPETENMPTIHYTGTVWCPETEYGSFMARRNGAVYLTGNTYNDEMCGQALMHLSQVGLQFDESQSGNAFSWYTSVMANDFKRVLNTEKRSQHLRDDLLIMGGATPSFTRQIEHEIAQKFGEHAPPNHSVIVKRYPTKAAAKPVVAKPVKTKVRAVKKAETEK